jgi:hypothetical protein
VIVITHISERELTDGTRRGFPSAIGSALGSIIPKYFNTLILAESTSTGRIVSRTIKTMPTNLIDLKNPAPWKFKAELPLDTGLATIFEGLKQVQQGEKA